VKVVLRHRCSDGGPYEREGSTSFGRNYERVRGDCEQRQLVSIAFDSSFTELARIEEEAIARNPERREKRTAETLLPVLLPVRHSP
jgi:hypothetical protein